MQGIGQRGAGRIDNSGVVDRSFPAAEDGRPLSQVLRPMWW